MSGRQDKRESRDVTELRSDDGRVTLWCAPELAERLIGRGLLADVPLAAIDGAAASGFAGRGRPLLLELGGERLVAKAMLHGGLFGRLLADRFAGFERARALVELLTELAARGVATPPLAFARARRSPSGFFRLDLATRELAGVQDGLAFLRSRPHPRIRREAVRAAARVVRALHDAGVEHADLNVKNLLVRAGPPDSPIQAFVIDLEKSRRSPRLEPAAAVRNLERLARSAEKLGLLGTHLSRADLVRFARAYDGDDGLSWRDWFTAAQRRWRTWGPWHRLGWALFGRGK